MTSTTKQVDVVEVHITPDVPIRALPLADRLEIRLGRAFPVVLIVDRAVFYDFADAINNCEHAMTATPQNLEG